MDIRNRILSILLGSGLLFSCAQVGILSGGEDDINPPRPERFDPPQGSLQFTAKTIEIRFDEFVKLDNPSENLVVQPADLKVEARLQGKKLFLDLLSTPSPNTTYLISMRGLVKDIHEGNDSLMHYVFSTGISIDSMRYTGRVIDALSNEPRKGMLVGLFAASDSLNAKPRYFVQSDEEGAFEFNYLAAGSYRMLAFQDDNRNLSWQNQEAVAYLPDPIALDSSRQDTVPMRVSPGKSKLLIRHKKADYPRLMRLGVGEDFRSDSLRVPGMADLIPAQNLYFFRPDSVAVLLPQVASEQAELIYPKLGLPDTLRVRPSKGKVTCHIIPADKEISATHRGLLLWSDEITAIDTSRIILTYADGKRVPYQLKKQRNQLWCEIADTVSMPLTFSLKQGALQFTDPVGHDSLQVQWQIKAERAFGSLRIPKQYFPPGAFLELLQNGNQAIMTISATQLQSDQLLRFLAPGKYRFRMIQDLNQNGRWDGGNPLMGTQPEEVLYFPQEITLRANWENEILFDLKP